MNRSRKKNKKISQPEFNKPHLPALDGLRGCAILLVVLGHLALIPQLVFYRSLVFSSAAESVLFHLMELGWCGVDLFFVISGYLITGILMDIRDNRGSLTSFYARRALRILPIYYCFLFIYFYLNPLSHMPGIFHAENFKNQLWYWFYLPNFTRTDGVYRPGELIHLWSLAVEEQFYLFFPLLVRFLPRKLLIYVPIFGLIACNILRILLRNDGFDTQTLYTFTFTRLDGLAMGVLLSILLRGSRIQFYRSFAKFLIVPSVILLILVLVSSGHFSDLLRLNRRFSGYSETLQIFGYPLFVLIFGSLLTIVVTAPIGSRVQGFFSNRVLRFFGNTSYGSYLFHPVFFTGLTFAGLEVLKLRNWFSFFPLLGDLLYILFFAALSGVIGYLSWFGIERHFLRLKSKFPYYKNPSH